MIWPILQTQVVVGFLGYVYYLWVQSKSLEIQPIIWRNAQKKRRRLRAWEANTADTDGVRLAQRPPLIVCVRLPEAQHMCENHEKTTRQDIKGQKIITSASHIPIVYQSWSTSDFRCVTHMIDKKIQKPGFIHTTFTVHQSQNASNAGVYTFCVGYNCYITKNLSHNPIK